MIQKDLISKEKINIVVVLNKTSNKSLFEQIFLYISDYLKLNIIYIENFNITDIDNINSKIGKNEKIDFYFVDFVKEYEHIFAWNFYFKMHEMNRNFKLVLFTEKIDEKDIQYFKNGADDIIYKSQQYYGDNTLKYLTWKTFSLLRRKWDFSHTNTVLNRHGVIIDLLKRSVIVNNKKIKMTVKEFEFLNILIDELNGKNGFVSKNKIFKKIYGIDNLKNSRSVDQLIFRVKNKFPSNFFEFDKKKNIRIA